MSDHTEPQGRRRLVCIGLRLDTRNRLATFFLDEEGNRFGWRKPVLGPAVPGSQYDVAFAAEGAPIISGEHGPRYVGRLPVDDSRVLEWTAEQRLAELAAEQEARARRDAGEDASRRRADRCGSSTAKLAGPASARPCWPCSSRRSPGSQESALALSGSGRRGSNR